MISKYVKEYITGDIKTAHSILHFVSKTLFEIQNSSFWFIYLLFSPLDDAFSTAQATETELIATQKLPRRFAGHNEAVINYEEKLTAV